jgi:hypothetical protein
MWNLAVEQQSWWRPGRTSAPGWVEQCRQLTQARAEHAWLAAGSVIVQQQALRDYAQTMTNFFNGSHRKPTWRKAGRDEGFRIVALRPGHVRRLNRKTGEVFIPKAGWVRFRRTRTVPEAKSYRVKLAWRFDVIRVEDLRVRDMTRSAKGTVAEPGGTFGPRPG